MPAYVLCRVDQLIEGRGRPARAAGKYLAVFLVNGEVHVLDNLCLHVGSPIDSGPVRDGIVHCPWHGWAYRLADGSLVTAFGDRPGLRTYDHGITEAGEVEVNLADEAPVGD